MCLKKYHIFFLLLISGITTSKLFSQQIYTTPQLLSSSGADTWSFIDSQGRSSGNEGAKGIREDKYVGIFYFVWQGAHGFDKHGGGRGDEGVIDKADGDTLSPYDNSKLIAENPADPQYGPDHAWHYWGEPYFGYYLPDDEWIIRKHAQMLSDAGVDVLILDVTNAHIYLPQVTKIAEVYRKMRREGLSTPTFAFIVNSNPAKTVSRLYESIYKKQLFKDLWFVWKGKPLLLCPPEAVTPEIDNFFNVRQSWAWSEGQKWFGNGKDKWTWVDHTPQAYGWHEDSTRPEQISVSTAEHPVSNIGRSFHNGRQPPADSLQSTKGLYFKEQWERALAVDPEFVFITGWNEWVAMRFTEGKAKNFLGKKIEKGETYFVDQYNAEYSRDIEPENGELKDDYYYQMVHYIREFKGQRESQITKNVEQIKIDGKFSDWQNVLPKFTDDIADTSHRNHPGWGRIQAYQNFSGRNDISEARMAEDKEYIYCYVKTNNLLTQRTGKDWMILFMRTCNDTLKAWEGFNYRINTSDLGKNKISIERNLGGWNWQQTGVAIIAVGSKEIEIKIFKENIGITKNIYSINFKWADNSVPDGNPMQFMDKGDAAPNSRFTYEYRSKVN